MSGGCPRNKFHPYLWLEPKIPNLAAGDFTTAGSKVQGFLPRPLIYSFLFHQEVILVRSRSIANLMHFAAFSLFPAASAHHPAGSAHHPGAFAHLSAVSAHHPEVSARHPGVSARYPKVSARYPDSSAVSIGDISWHPAVSAVHPGAISWHPADIAAFLPKDSLHIAIVVERLQLDIRLSVASSGTDIEKPQGPLIHKYYGCYLDTYYFSYS